MQTDNMTMIMECYKWDKLNQCSKADLWLELRNVVKYYFDKWAKHVAKSCLPKMNKGRNLCLLAFSWTNTSTRNKLIFAHQ